MTQAWDFIDADDLWQTWREVIDKPIEDLELSVRVYNCLHFEGIKTLGDLTECTERDLMLLTNFGKRCLREVREVLAQYNLTLEGDHPWGDGL